jgi:hypothetical protein
LVFGARRSRRQVTIELADVVVVVKVQLVVLARVNVDVMSMDNLVVKVVVLKQERVSHYVVASRCRLHL